MSLAEEIATRGEDGIPLSREALGTCVERGIAGNYDPSKLRRRFAVLGFGNLARGLIASKLDLANRGGFGEGIIAVGFTSTEKHKLALKQNGLYTLVEAGNGHTISVVASAPDWYFAPEQPEEILEALSAPDLGVVFISVKRSGYYLSPGNGLDSVKVANTGDKKRGWDGNPETPAVPRTPVGFLYEALMRRRKRGIEPFRIVTCDNMFDSGPRMAECLQEYAGKDTPEAVWIADNVEISSSVVDRICRAVPEAGLEVYKRFNIVDRLPVLCGAESSWTVQGRPIEPFANFGVRFIERPEDYAKFERMKYWLVNGGHMTAAMVGSLMQRSLVHEVVGDGKYCDFIRRWLGEVAAVVDFPDEVVPEEYVESIIARFRNARFPDPVNRIGTDAAYKVRNYHAGAMQRSLERGQPVHHQALALAAWIYAEWQSHRHKEENGEPALWCLDKNIPARTVDVCIAMATSHHDPHRMAAILADAKDVLGFQESFIPQVAEALCEALRNIERFEFDGAIAVH